MVIEAEFEQWLGSVTVGSTVADDGFPLTYQTFGETSGGGPAVVFANGIGVMYPGAALQIAGLRRDHRVVCWDYRGMGDSVSIGFPGDVSPGRHARDILRILDALEIERAVYVGWSMGVHVGLEVIRRAPARVSGFAALMGSYATPIRNAFGHPMGQLAEQSVEFGLVHPSISQTFIDLSVSHPDITHRILSRMRFVAPEVNRPVFDYMVRSVARTDRRLYLRTMLSMAEHDASDILPTLTCPSLVVCGELDFLTPPRVAQEMATAIPGAFYRAIPDGTHFALAEHPTRINRWLRDLTTRA